MKVGGEGDDTDDMDDIIDSMDISLNKLWEFVTAWHAAVHGVAKSWTQLSLTHYQLVKGLRKYQRP